MTELLIGTEVGGDQSSEDDAATRWLAHYEAVERQRSALGAVHRRLRRRIPGSRRHRRAVATLVAVCLVLACAAFAVLWR